ncbi:MAG: hypothetical protein WCF23_22675 [Candidatus Nitrosopolaris sp.]
MAPVLFTQEEHPISVESRKYDDKHDQVALAAAARGTFASELWA